MVVERPKRPSVSTQRESIPFAAKAAGYVGLGLIAAGVLGLTTAGIDTFLPNPVTHTLIQELATLTHQSYADTWGELGTSWLLALPGSGGVAIALHASPRRNK